MKARRRPWIIGLVTLLSAMFISLRFIPEQYAVRVGVIVVMMLICILIIVLSYSEP